MKNFSNILAGQLLIVALWLGLGGFPRAVAQEQPTIQSINDINGFHDFFAAIKRSFQDGFDEFPGPKPEKLVDAWVVASEEAFDADRLLVAAEARMAGKLTDAELRELYEYFSSPLGHKVSALEIASAKAGDTKTREAEGERIFKDLAAKDPERLALYNRMLEGLGAVDFAEVVTLNMTYSMVAGMFAAADTPVSDEAMLALVKEATADIRQTSEKILQADTAITYRDLPNDELEKHVDFLETPAGARYYEVSLQAVDQVLSKEAREFGNRLFAVLGMRKA
jgi:hypothetical protein